MSEAEELQADAGDFHWRRNIFTLVVPGWLGVLGICAAAVTIVDISLPVRVCFVLAGLLLAVYLVLTRRRSYLALASGKLTFNGVFRHWELPLADIRRVDKKPGSNKITGLILIDWTGTPRSFGLNYFGSPREVATVLWERLRHAEFSDSAKSLIALCVAGGLDGKWVWKDPKDPDEVLHP